MDNETVVALLLLLGTLVPRIGEAKNSVKRKLKYKAANKISKNKVAGKGRRQIPDHVRGVVPGRAVNEL